MSKSDDRHQGVQVLTLRRQQTRPDEDEILRQLREAEEWYADAETEVAEISPLDALALAGADED